MFATSSTSTSKPELKKNNSSMKGGGRMKVSQGSIQYFEVQKISTLEELKTMYYLLCKKYHPDQNPDMDEAHIKMINAEYIVLRQLFETNRFEGYKGQEDEIDQIFVDMYLKICDLPLDIELVGSWIWVTGDTYPHREELKKAGYFFARKKVCWYWRPPEHKSRSSGKDLDEIRAIHGSTKFNSEIGRKFLQ